MGAKDASSASSRLCFKAERYPLLSLPSYFFLYPPGTQAGASAWQVLDVSTASRQPSALRMKVSLSPPA